MEIERLKGGKYRVCSVLGAGGFGITYQCMDQESGAVCAVKEYMPEAIASRDPHTGRILPDAEKEKAFLHGKGRFLEEADILMGMGHIPSVVRVWESFEENGTAYYVMEFLKGITLKRLMRSMGGRLPYPLACETIEKAGRALDMIHRQAGIFHRDISPENIMVMPDGEVKIIDFGSAKNMSVSENQQFSVVLKPGFAPPEQYASNLSQGSFTDVYALAGTFYYAASGKMIPVAPDRLMGVEYESLDRLVPACSGEASAAVDRALLLDPKFRTQTVSEFIEGVLPKGVRMPGRRSLQEAGAGAAEMPESHNKHNERYGRNETEASGIGAGAADEAGRTGPGKSGSRASGIQGLGVPGNGVSGTGRPGSRYSEPGSRDAEPGRRDAGPGSGYTEPGNRYTEPGSGYTGPGNRDAGLGSGYTETGSRYTEPGTGADRTEQEYGGAAFGKTGEMREEKAEAWLEVVAGACAGSRFPVPADFPVTVGRSGKKSRIVLSGHPEVSGCHFRLLYAPLKSGFYVIDESVNGLYYKGIRLEKGKKYKVLPGDRIGVGSMQCVITVGVG